MNRDPLNKKRSLRFETTKNKNNKKTSAFLLSFIAFVVVFGGLSVMLLIVNSGGDIDKMIGIDKVKPTDEITSSNGSEMILPEVSGKANFLLILEDDDVLEMCAVVHADMDKLKLTVRVLDPEEKSGDKTLQKSYSDGGLQGLKTAVEGTGVEIDRYAATDEKGFRSIFKSVGNNVTVNVPQKINVSSDKMSLRLNEGEQKMTAVTLSKYLRCDSPSKEAKLKAQETVLCALLDQLINEDNLSQGENLFGTIVNELKTDISALDYVQNQSCLEVLVRSGKRQPTEAVDSYKDFK